MNLKEELSWYAVYTKSRMEKKCAELLSERGIAHYLPLQTTIKQWSDRKKKVTEPFFKSYIFVQINYQTTFLDVLSIYPVVKFVKIGTEITSIRPQIIEAIKLSLSCFDEQELVTIDFKPNEKVKVIAGPLLGNEGFIINKSGNKYFAIHIEQLGAGIALKLPANHLAPL